MGEFVDEFGSFVSNADMMTRAGASDVHEQLERLLLALDERNELYDAIRDRVEAAVTEHRSLGIFTPTPAWRHTLMERLLEDKALFRHTLGNKVQVTDRESVRDIDRCNELLIAGPQRKQHIGCLVHPNAEHVTILTYEGRYKKNLQNRLHQFIDRINAAFQVTDSALLPYPEISVSNRSEGEEATEDADTDGFEGRVEEESGSRVAEEADSLEDRLSEHLDNSRFGREFDHDTSRYDDYVHQDFDIETEDGETLHRESGTRLLVEERIAHWQDVETEYGWRSPAELSKGTTILEIDSWYWNKLWDEWLDERYADIEGGRVTDQLRTWYDTISEILTEIQEEVGADEPTETVVYHYIIGEARSVGIDRSSVRVRDWFESVAIANDALELARDPSLTMGPRAVEDIQLIGKAFDKPALKGSNGNLIDAGLRKIRGAHIHQGSEIREHVAKTLTEGGDDCEMILQHSTSYVVKAVIDVTEN
ncbi:hypothetical protein ACFQH3_20280 [Haladaptatus sp. GCM10025707]